MKLSTIFFILTPFGFFCTGNGTGLITGPVFLIIGFILKWIENGGVERVSRPKVSSEEFWTIQFLQHYNTWKDIKEAHNTAEGSKSWADQVTRANGGVPVTDARFEQIAKENGIVTRKMQFANRARFNRIQLGKYYLMGKLIKKYKGWKREPANKREYRWVEPVHYIEASRKALKFATWTYGLTEEEKKVVDFGFTENNEEGFNKLTAEEKSVAEKWVNEYEARFLEEVNSFIENGVPMPTIDKHYKRNATYEFDKKYGFEEPLSDILFHI